MHIVFKMKHNVHMLVCINKNDFGSNKFYHAHMHGHYTTLHHTSQQFAHDRMFVKGPIQQQQLPFHWSPPNNQPM